MEFMVGDKINILEKEATVTEYYMDGMLFFRKMTVLFENGDVIKLIKHQTSLFWNLDVDIKLIKRPKKKVKKKFYLGYKSSSSDDCFITSHLYLNKFMIDPFYSTNIIEVEIEVDEE